MSDSMTAQRRTSRPKLRPISRDYFAGKILFIPLDERPSSYRQPQMIAWVADHDLVSPPLSMLNDPDQLAGWLKECDFNRLDGAILSLERLAGGETAEARSRLGIIKLIRERRPQIPIYGFFSSGRESSAILPSIIELTHDGTLDLAVIDPETAGGSAVKNLLAARGLTGRILTNSEPGSTTVNLVTRMLNQRFGFSPRILPVYSTGAGQKEEDRREELPIYRQVAEQIELIGGTALSQPNEPGRAVEVLLFVHTSQSDAMDRAALVDTIGRTIEKNVRVALADLSETKESRGALLSELRKRKFLDRLASYASSDPAEDPAGVSAARAISSALTQSSAFLLSIRFLRDDLERVRRIDRAQINLLIGRYLSDWAWPALIRPRVADRFSRIRPDESLESLESEAGELLRPVSEELFNEQFRRNLHAILLNTGERAQFEIRLLQRLRLRLAPAKNSSKGYVPEISPSVYLVYMGNVPTPLQPSSVLWELTTGDLDDRLIRKWNETYWPAFKVDAESVEMKIRIEGQPGIAAPEGYSISNKKSRHNRRIEISAATPQGAFHALSKLTQIGAEGGLIQDFQLTESPVLEIRGISERYLNNWSIQDRIETIRFLGQARMNRYFYDPGPSNGNGNEDLEKLARESEENFVRLVYVIDPETQDLSGPADKLRSAATLGISSFALALKVPPTDRQQDLKSMADKQSRLVNDLRVSLTGGAEFFVFPDDLENSFLKSEYLTALLDSIQPSIPFILTAAQRQSLSPQSISRHEKRIIVMDDRLENSRDPDRICIEAFRTFDANLAGGSAGFVINPMIQRLSSQPAILTAAAYAWNPAGYNSGVAKERAMNFLFDERSHAGLQFWINNFGGCHVDRNPLLSLVSRSAQQPSRSEIAGLERTLAELRLAAEAITGTRDRGLLRGELMRFISRAGSALERTRPDDRNK